MLGAAILSKFETRDEAYFAYAKDARAQHDTVHSLDWFDTYWRGIKGLPRADSSSITQEKEPKMARLTSPFVHDNVEVAYAAYCNMPAAHRGDFVKPTRRQFAKLYAERHPAAVAKSKPAAQLEIPAVPASTSFDPAVIAQIVGAVIANLGGNTPEVAESEPVVESDYRDRKDRAEVPSDAARNSILWALNSEDLLVDAIDAAEDAGLSYISQEIATRIMEENFGPLADR